VYSTPGIGGLAVIWNGSPNRVSGTPVSLSDVDFNYSTDTSVIGSTATGQLSSKGPETEELIGYGDFNGDGQTDLLWRTTLTDRLTIWEMAGHQVLKKLVSAQYAGPVFFSGPAKGYIADLDGDGISDIVWTGVVGSASANSFRTLTWIMQADSITPAQTSTSDSDTTEVIGVGNFDGDPADAGPGPHHGHADLLTRATRADGMVTLVTAAGVSSPIVQVPTSTGWVMVGVGDFNADLCDDALWYNTQTGDVTIWQGSGPSSTMIQQGVLANVPPSSGWTIVGTGRLPYVLNSDILWQNKSTRQTSIWKMADSMHVTEFGAARNFDGNSVAGFMNVAEPPPPTELTYTVSGSTATFRVKNNDYVKGNTGTTLLELRTDAGNTSLITFAAVGTGYFNIPVPLSQLGFGNASCVMAYAWYHDRQSAPSNVICEAGTTAPAMQALPPIPDMRPNLAVPGGVTLCNRDLSSCGFTPHVKDQFALHWSVCNTGPTTVGATKSRVMMHATGFGEGGEDHDVPALTSGACFALSSQIIGYSAANALVTFEAYADAFNAFGESNEGDNWVSSGTPILP
jgi:hypothetical protein